MQLTTDKFEITYCGAFVYDSGYEEDEFRVTLLERNELCRIGYDYSKNCLSSIQVLNQVISSDRNICEDSGRNLDDIHNDIHEFDFELRSIFRFMHDLGYYVQEY